MPRRAPNKPSPLEGLRVLEVAGWLAAPAAAALLADMGADVTKVEPPGGDTWRHYRPDIAARDGRPLDSNPGFAFDNRGKRSIVIDVATEAGRDTVLRLVERADVYITNLTPSRSKRFGLTYAAVRRRNPRIIYLQFTGFGSRGPDRDKLGYDEIAFWARSGMMAGTAEPGQPPAVLRPGMGDHTTSLALVGGILAAIIQRDRTGKGQRIEGSLLSTGVFVQGDEMQGLIETGREAPKRSRTNPFSALDNTYQTSDGRWVMLSMPRAKFWPNLCRALGLDDLAADPELATDATQAARSEELATVLDHAFAAKTLRALRPRLNAEGVIWAPMMRTAEVLADPQVKANGIVAESPDGALRTLGMPIRFDGATVGPRGGAPGAGEHTDAVLREAGFDGGEIAALRAAGVVA